MSRKKMAEVTKAEMGGGVVPGAEGGARAYFESRYLTILGLDDSVIAGDEEASGDSKLKGGRGTED